MARTIRFRALASPSLFSKNFGVPLQLLIDACGEDEYLFKNTEVAKSDADDVKYLTNEGGCARIFSDFYLCFLIRLHTHFSTIFFSLSIERACSTPFQRCSQRKRK